MRKIKIKKLEVQGLLFIINKSMRKYSKKKTFKSRNSKVNFLNIYKKGTS